MIAQVEQHLSQHQINDQHRQLTGFSIRIVRVKSGQGSQKQRLLG